MGGNTTGNIGASGSNLHLSNGNVSSYASNMNSVGHNYPMTSHSSSLSDAVNILEYNNSSTVQDGSSGTFLRLTSLLI
ncbi:unnamed protein product [Trichobilharzia regenti]|nr:unnamed protein product [Trichobilharzia regenti]